MRNRFTDADVSDQSGKCFIVTGANSGIGFQISRVLAAKRAKLLLACRDRTKAGEAMERIRKETPGADLTFLQLNLADLDSVRVAASEAASQARIDGLINNAGVMQPTLARTAQGFEMHFGTNHLGCFALTTLLLPTLARTPGSRVVVTASSTHHSGKIDWDSLNSEKGFNKARAYANSKLANMLFFFELDRRLRAAHSMVTAVGCHPGIAPTELVREEKLFRLVMPLVSPFLNTPVGAAWPALQAATGAIEPGGFYGPTGFHGIKGPSGPSTRSKSAEDAEVARRLWDVSAAMTDVNPGLPAVPAAR